MLCFLSMVSVLSFDRDFILISECKCLTTHLPTLIQLASNWNECHVQPHNFGIAPYFTWSLLSNTHLISELYCVSVYLQFQLAGGSLKYRSLFSFYLSLLSLSWHVLIKQSYEFSVLVVFFLLTTLVKTFPLGKTITLVSPAAKQSLNVTSRVLEALRWFLICHTITYVMNS